MSGESPAEKAKISEMMASNFLIPEKFEDPVSRDVLEDRKLQEKSDAINKMMFQLKSPDNIDSGVEVAHKVKVGHRLFRLLHRPNTVAAITSHTHTPL